MKPIYRLYTLIFCQIAAPALVVGGFIINAIVEDVASLPKGFKQELNWFQENPDTSEMMVTMMFVVGGILAVVAVITAISIVASKKGTDDAKLGIGVKKRKHF